MSQQSKHERGGGLCQTGALRAVPGAAGTCKCQNARLHAERQAGTSSKRSFFRLKVRQKDGKQRRAAGVGGGLWPLKASAGAYPFDLEQHEALYTLFAAPSVQCRENARECHSSGAGSFAAFVVLDS